MQIGPFTLARTKSLTLRPLSAGTGSWWPIIRESFTGAWQANVEVRAQDVLTYSAVYACVSLISGDIAKLCLRLVDQDKDGIWNEADSPSFSPVLRRPNRYQNRIKFVEQWITSKLTQGNTYVLKQRDHRGVVTALYLLDPSRVTPLVTPDGAVYYQIRRDDLAEVRDETITVPAREIIHDIMCALWHPLIGVTPIYACGVAALQGISIQSNSKTFFENGSNPSGMLTAPATIPQETATRLQAYWDTNYGAGGGRVGKVAVAGDGLKYEPFTMSAVDAQLIEQLKWTAETVCSAFHVPAYMIGVGPPPPYANIEPLLQQYYAQALQTLIESFELCLDEGLELDKVTGHTYGTEFDLDDLFRMDTATKTTAAREAIGSGGMSPNEARYKYFDLGPVVGGDTPYMQQQQFSLRALHQRDQDEPFAKPATPPPAAAAASTDATATPTPTAMAAHFGAALRKHLIEAELYAA
jgi:HK97 family phage portal protein